MAIVKMNLVNDMKSILKYNTYKGLHVWVLTIETPVRFMVSKPNGKSLLAAAMIETPVRFMVSKP